MGGVEVAEHFTHGGAVDLDGGTPAGHGAEGRGDPDGHGHGPEDIDGAPGAGRALATAPTGSRDWSGCSAPAVSTTIAPSRPAPWPTPRATTSSRCASRPRMRPPPWAPSWRSCAPS